MSTRRLREERTEYEVEDDPGTIQFADTLLQRWPTGFLRIPLGIALDPFLSYQAKLVAAVLGWYAWHNNQAWPGQAKIAKWFKDKDGKAVHRNTISGWIAELVERGYVERTLRGLPARYHYTLHFGRAVATNPPHQDASSSEHQEASASEHKLEPYNENQENKSSKSKSFTAFQKANGSFNDLQIADLTELIETFGDDVVEAAIKEQARSNTSPRVNLKYVARVAEHWNQHQIGCECQKEGKYGQPKGRAAEPGDPTPRRTQKQFRSGERIEVHRL